METTNKNLKSLRSSLKQGLITGVKKSLGAMHIGLRYGIDVVEEADVKFSKRMTGEDRKSVVDSIRINTNRARLENKRLYNKVMADLRSSMNDIGLGNKSSITDDVIVETINHGE